MASGAPGLELPETAIVKVASFCGVREVPSLCCISRSWRRTVGENPLFADWLYATTCNVRTSGPQSKWARRHQDVLSTHESSYFNVNAVRGWAAGLYAAHGVSVGRDLAVSCLAWGSQPSEPLLVDIPGAAPASRRLLLAGHVDGSVSMFAAGSHRSGGHVCGASQGQGLPLPLQGSSAGLLRVHQDTVTGVAGLSAGAFGGNLTPPAPGSQVHSLSGGLDGRAVVSKWTFQEEPVQEDGAFRVQHAVQHVWEEGAVGSPVNGMSAVGLGSGSPLAVLALDCGDLLTLDVATGGTGVRIPAHGRSAYCVEFAPEGGAYGSTLLASGGFDSCVRLWDMRLAGPAPVQLAMPHAVGANSNATRPQRAAGIAAEHIALEGHEYRAYDLAWSPCGNFLASVGGDLVLRIWDMRAPRSPLHKCRLAKRWSDCTAWVGGSRGVLVAGQDHSVRVFGHSRYESAASTRVVPSLQVEAEEEHASDSTWGSNGAASTAGSSTHAPSAPPLPSELRAWGGLHTASSASLAVAAAAAREPGQQTLLGVADSQPLPSMARSKLDYGVPTAGRYCGIVDRHAGMVTCLLTDGEDTVFSAATDGTLTMRVLQPFKHHHLQAVMHAEGVTATAAVPPRNRAEKGGKGGGFAIPESLQRRLNSSAARSAENKRFDSLGAYRIPAGTRMGRNKLGQEPVDEIRCVAGEALASSAAAAASGVGSAHTGESAMSGNAHPAEGCSDCSVQHRLWTAGAVQAMNASLPRASWQQGGNGAKHRSTCYRIGREGHKAAREAISRLNKK